MILRWLRSGRDSLREQIAWIAAENPQAAQRVRHRIHGSLQILLDFPESGRVGRIADTRELIVAGLPYVIIYRIRNQAVEILRVVHMAQDWPLH